MKTKSKLAVSAGFTTFLFKLVLFGILISIISMLFGNIGIVVFAGLMLMTYYFLKSRTAKRALREQLKFMKSQKQIRTVNMIVGRWGDYIYVNCFGINFAADSDNSEDIKYMIKDIAILTKTLRTTGKLPKGKFYSEMTAYYIKNLGLDVETIRWKCYTDVLCVIDYLIKLSFTHEPNMMNDWVNAVSIELKNQGRTVYHRSFIERVILHVEDLSAELQIDARRAGGLASAKN